jgi:hypothetical protein
MKTIEDKFGKTLVHEPKECYFAVVKPKFDNYPPALIFISDKETWDKNKYSGEVYFEDNVLPEDLLEFMECVWESHLPTDQLKEMLLKIGFTYCPEMESEINDFD